jgi:hypothetical protein
VRLKEKDGMALDNSGISILNLRLKTILDTLKDVEEVWYVIDLSAFSSKKKLFDYQESALRNAIKGFYYFYGKYRGSKEDFFEDVYRNILPESFPINERLVDLYQNGYIINSIVGAKKYE